MAIPFSCPFPVFDDFENVTESVTVKSVCNGDNEEKTLARSTGFGRQDFMFRQRDSLCLGETILKRSVSSKGGELESRISRRDSSSENFVEMVGNSQNLDPSDAKDRAAIKLQKVYKSLRIRRKLADSAVLVEQSWWKLLDFVKLKQSSISFFDAKRHETVISRWLRARTGAAQVGKGLSKNEKSPKLALQFWLEVIDPRHRYGHNQHFYYVKWLNSESREPFFYWLDIGEGKEVNVEVCPRLQLQRQRIKYLGPMERVCYEVAVEDGKLFYKRSGELVHTTSDSVWIFVLSTSNTFYVGKKKKGMFQHSSFLAGGAVTCAGKLTVEHGILKEVWPQSGHYQPTVRDFKRFLSFLQQNNVDQRFLCFRKNFRLLWDMATRGFRFLIREYKILKLGQNAISFWRIDMATVRFSNRKPATVITKSSSLLS